MESHLKGDGKPNRRLFCFGMFVVACIAINFLGCQKSHMQGGEECVNNSQAYLEMLKKGDAGANRLWKAGADPVSIVSVQDYSLINQGDVFLGQKPYPIPRVYYQYSVDSITKNGVRMHKIWDIHLEPSSLNLNGSRCAIVALHGVR